MFVINYQGKESQTGRLHMPFHQQRNVGGETTQDESRLLLRTIISVCGMSVKVTE
jgi:hypothetical protein